MWIHGTANSTSRAVCPVLCSFRSIQQRTSVVGTAAVESNLRLSSACQKKDDHSSHNQSSGYTALHHAVKRSFTQINDSDDSDDTESTYTIYLNTNAISTIAMA